MSADRGQSEQFVLSPRPAEGHNFSNRTKIWRPGEKAFNVLDCLEMSGQDLAAAIMKLRAGVAGILGLSITSLKAIMPAHVR